MRDTTVLVMRGRVTTSGQPLLLRVGPHRDAGFVWRLMAHNGRAVGRSGGVFESVPDAHAAARSAVELGRAAKLSGSVGHHPSGGWTWTVSGPGGAAVALAARTYDRRDSCARSLHRVLSAMAELPLPAPTARGESPIRTGRIDPYRPPR